MLWGQQSIHCWFGRPGCVNLRTVHDTQVKNASRGDPNIHTCPDARVSSVTGSGSCSSGLLDVAGASGGQQKRMSSWPVLQQGSNMYTHSRGSTAYHVPGSCTVCLNQSTKMLGYRCNMPGPSHSTMVLIEHTLPRASTATEKRCASASTLIQGCSVLSQMNLGDMVGKQTSQRTAAGTTCSGTLPVVVRSSTASSL